MVDAASIPDGGRQVGWWWQVEWATHSVLAYCILHAAESQQTAGLRDTARATIGLCLQRAAHSGPNGDGCPAILARPFTRTQRGEAERA